MTAARTASRPARQSSSAALAGASPYRLYDPKVDFSPSGNVRSVASERAGWISEGDIGTGSCGPVGPGGWTGCMQQGWRRARQQRGWYQ